MKHKHADLIHAWADGAEIQFLNKFDEWQNESNPYWDEEREYRIKPEEKKPVVRWLWVWKSPSDRYIVSDMMSEEESERMADGSQFIKLEWSRTEFPE